MPIPVSGLPCIGFTLTLPDAATVVAIDDVTKGAAAVPPPANCRSIVFYNTDDTNDVYMKIALTGTAGAMSILDSVIVPANGSYALPLLPEGKREPIGSTEAVCCYLRTAGGVSIQVNISYVMGEGV